MAETAKPKRTRGRPRKPGGPRGKVTLAFSEAEWSAISEAAKSAGLTAAEYVRRWAVAGHDLLGDITGLLSVVEVVDPCLPEDYRQLEHSFCRCVRRSLSRITGP